LAINADAALWALVTPAFPWLAKELVRVAKRQMLYYNIDMSDHPPHPHHHHHPGHVHPPATVHPSILRLSIVERLAAAAAVIALIWAATFWAMR
jgi:hypothetical protein